MKNFRNPAPVFGAMLAVLLAGCATVPGPVVKRGADPLAADRAAVVGMSPDTGTDAEGIATAPVDLPRPVSGARRQRPCRHRSPPRRRRRRRCRHCRRRWKASSRRN